MINGVNNNLLKLGKRLVLATIAVGVLLVFGLDVNQVQAAQGLGTQAQNNNLSADPSTFSFTANSTSTVVILHLYIAGSTARTGGAPTYGSITMTQADSTRCAVESCIEVWYLIDPPTGANTMSIPNSNTRTIDTLTATANAQTGYTSALDVATGKTNQATANPTSTITTTVDGDFITFWVGHGIGALTGVSGNMTAYGGVWGFDSGNFSYLAQYEQQSAAGATTHQITVGADDWSASLVSFKEVLKTVTIGDSTAPSDATVGPGGAATLVDNFTLQTNSGTFTPTNATTTVAAGTTSTIAKVEIRNSDGSVTYGSSTNPVANSFSIALSGVTATSTTSTLTIYITPKAHADMPAVPGATSIVTSTITTMSGTGDHTVQGSDPTSATLSVDNLSPSDVTNATTTPGSGQIDITWTNPGADFSNVIVVRATSTPNTGTPAEGGAYNVGDVIPGGNGSVIYNSNGTSTTDTGLAGSTTYYYKIWAKDTRGNYSTPGVEVSGTTSAATVSISGSCKQWDQATSCANSETVKVAVNGNLQAQTGSTSGGSWSIAGVTQPTTGDVITVFLDGVVTANRAVAVTKYNGVNIAGVNLFERHLAIGSADNQTLSNSELSRYDNSSSSDADVFFDVDTSNNLITDVNGNFSDEKLIVRAGNTYQPDSSGAERIITTENFQASSTATFTANGSVVRIARSFQNNGTFTAGTSTVEFGATSTIDCASCTFYNLTASSTAVATTTTSFTVSNILQVVGTLNIDSGQTLTSSATTTVSGTVGGSGTLKITSDNIPTGGILTASVTADLTSAGINIPNRTYGGNLTILNTGATNRTATSSSGTITVSGDLDVQSSGAGTITLNAATNSSNFTITGSSTFSGAGGTKTITTGSSANTFSISGNANFASGTYTAGSGNTLKMAGTGTLTTSLNTLQNLEINSGGTVTLAAATHTVAGNLTLAGGGTPTVTGSTILMTSSTAAIDAGGKALNNLTASSTGTITLQNTNLTAAGTLTVATSTTLSVGSGLTLTHSGSTLNLNGTISGAGRLTYQSATAFPVIGNASSTLRFDTAANNQIISARTYGGLVEIDNSGATTGRTVTLGTGASQTITLQNGLDVAESGTGDVNLTAATNNPAVNITGNVACSTGTGNTITTGTGSWTVSGSVNLTNCTYTATSGHTLIMSGSGTLTSNSQTLQNLTLSGTITLADATHLVGGNFNLSGGTITPGASTITMTSSTASITGGGATLNNVNASSTGTITLTGSDLTVGGTLTVATSTTLSISSSRNLTASSSLALNGVISGTGTLIYKSATAFPTTGTISSALTFDAINSNQNISNRTYTGAVKIDNSGATSGRTVTLGTGSGQTIAFSGNLDIAESGSGDVRLTGSANNPTVNISGNLTCSAGTGNNITNGTGTWTASGSTVNFTNCSLTSTAGTTLLINGSSPTLTTASQAFDNLDFTGATSPTISGNATSSGNVTLVSGTTLTGVTLTMTGQSKNLIGAGNTLPNLTIDGTAASTTIATSDLTVSGTLTLGADDALNIASSRVLTPQGTITLPNGGTITGPGTLKITDTSGGPGTTGTLGSVVRYDASAADIASSTFASRTYGGLVEAYASSTAARTLTLGSGPYTLSGGLNILADGTATTTLDASVNNPNVTIGANLDFTGNGSGNEEIKSGTGTWDISGNGDLTGGIYTAGAGNTLKMSGTGTLTTAGNTLSNLEINSSGTVTLAAATSTISGNLILAGSGTPTVTGSTILMSGTSGNTITGGGKTLNNLTVDPTSAATTTLQSSDLTVSGTLNVASGDTLSIASGINLTQSGSTLTLSGTVAGTGRLIYQSSTAFPTGGTVNSILRFDATGNGETMSARTYGGQVEVVNTGGTNRTVTMAAGNYNFSSNLLLFASSTANITLDGDANNASTTISGNLAYSGGGAGSEIVTASSSPWTISGNLDISNGNFTAPSGNLNLAGNYTNVGGTFTHNSGTLVLNGVNQQSLTGTMTGTSAFNNLTVANNSGSDPNTSPSVIFSATTTATTFTATTASSKIRFNASSTYTFTNINWNGQATTTRLALRSSVSTSTQWLLNVSVAGSKIVSNTDAKDSDASSGDEIPAADGTNLNSGGNTNWAFSVTSPSTSSTADDVFEINAASTTVSNINITSGGGSPGGKISSSTDIRLVIPAGFNATWDPSVTSITCSAGDSCAKISASGVTYESSNKIAVINAIQNFVSGDWVQISGLKMGNFTAVNASTTVHRVRVDGASDAVDDATDTRVKTIKGKLTEQEHGSGQTANLLDIGSGSLGDADLFRFRLVPTGENMNITTTTVNIVSVSGFVSGDITSAALYLDLNGNGSIDAGEPTVGAAGVVSISNGTGTVVFGGSWTATTTRDIIMRANVSNIDSGDNLKFSLPVNNINAKGVTTIELVTASGSASSINHAKSIQSFSGGGSGGGASGGAPPQGSTQSGGSESGGTSSSEGGGSPTSTPQGGGGSGGGGGGSSLLPQTQDFFATVESITRNTISRIMSFFLKSFGLIKN